MAFLRVSEPGRVAFTVELRSDFTVGRGSENDLVLTDPQSSRRHARFSPVEGGWRVIDLGSTHGTLVNRQKQTEAMINEGDAVQIGNVLLTFLERDDVSGAETLFRDVAATAPRRLELLYRVSRVVGALDDPDELLERVLTATLEVLGCERGVVGLLDGGSPGGRRLAKPAGGEDIVVSRVLLDAMLTRRESVLVRAGDAPATAVRHGVRSAMGAPLWTTQRVLGFIYVDDRSRADRFSPDELDFLTALAHLAAAALEQAEMRRRSSAVAEALRAAHPMAELLGESESMRRLRERVAKYARADVPVLIRGESGTGKELVAGIIHAQSVRAEEPFVAVNCAAIPDTLIESELFGHEKGAFTGAAKAKRGQFTLAHKGTLFLDEVGDLSAAAQAKVLRALQEGVIQPVGAEKPSRVDVRVLAATHRPLDEEIAAGRFREDLYYRLGVGEVQVPPLRGRGDDVVLLAMAFLQQASRRLGRPVPGFTPAALEALRRYGWPGNVRQLKNEVERAAILAEGSLLDLDELRGRIEGASPPRQAAATLAERFTQLDVEERELVGEALKQADGNVSEAARLLGITRIMMRRRLKRFGLDE